MNFYEQIFSRGRVTGEGMTHFERLFAAKFGGSPPPEVREYTGAVPVTITADGTPLLDYRISGNTTQNGTPTPDSPIMPEGCGELEAGQYKIPISSNSTTTPVYLGEVESTRQIKKLVLDGTENWDKGTYAFYSVITGIAAYKPVLCTHYQYYEGSSSGAPIDSISTGSGGGSAIWIKTQNHGDTTVEQWKSYLAAQYAAGTPVTVWYVLATEETAVVNEPLMRIGDYADTLSKAQALVSIPTNNGSTTVDVDTTVKPSEVYIKYMG